MIEINLLPGKRKAAKGAGFQLAMPDFKGLLAQVKDPWLIGAIAAWVIVGGGGAALFIAERARLAAAEARLTSVQGEKRKYDIVIAQKRQMEKVRDSLVYEIGVIRNIVQAVTLTLAPGAAPPANQPAAVAMDTSSAPAVRVAIEGRTVDIQAYTTFLRQLAASPWFTDVTPASSQIVSEADRPVTAFNVTVRYRVADSVYIRTVPLVQSLR